LKPYRHKLLSTFAFNFNLRRYTAEITKRVKEMKATGGKWGRKAGVKKDKREAEFDTGAAGWKLG